MKMWEAEATAMAGTGGLPVIVQGRTLYPDYRIPGSVHMEGHHSGRKVYQGVLSNLLAQLPTFWQLIEVCYLLCAAIDPKFHVGLPRAEVGHHQPTVPVPCQVGQRQAGGEGVDAGQGVAGNSP